MHVHADVLGFFVFACYAIIFGFFWRMLTLRFQDRPIGKAMAFVNG